MIVHASAVSLGGRGVLILGRSGAGKSGLALRLIALGAQLVSDDRVMLEPHGADGLAARAPATIRGLIEARGVGILRLEPVEPVPLVVGVDLDTAPEARLPQPGRIRFLERELELISGRGVANIEAVLTILMQGGTRVPV